MTKGMKLLKRFEDAVRMDEMQGAMEPSTWDAITREYKRAKKEIRAYIKELEEDSNSIPF